MMRGTLVSVFMACLFVGSAQPLAFGKKSKKDYKALLKALQTIYVDGSSVAVSYIRKNLSQETCLNNTLLESDADAILEVWEESPVPCQAMSGICSHIAAKLLDPKTKEVLWYREDESVPQVDLVHKLNGPYKWVLWNLKNSCCKGRLFTTPREDSKEYSEESVKQ